MVLNRHNFLSALAYGRPRAFTLVEAMLAMVIIGVGFVSMLHLFGACTKQNAAANHITTAMLLAENIQETMADLSFSDPAFGRTYYGPEPGQTLASFDDIDDFDNQMFNPPIDSTRQPIVGLPDYAQVVTVLPIYANKLSSNPDPAAPEISKATYTGTARITVRIMHRKDADLPFVEVYRSAWIRVAE